MKFAASRSSWHARGSNPPRRRSIRSAVAFAAAKPCGSTTPRARAVVAYASTTRKASNRPGIAGPLWRRRSKAAASGADTAPTSPSTKRVTRYPSGSTNATTSGPIPSAAALSDAACSTRRSIPSSSVSLPPTRSTNASPPVRTRKLRFVIPPPSGSTESTPPGHTRATTSSITPARARRPGRRAARPRPRPPPTRRRSRPRPAGRPRHAPPAGTRTRSSARPSSRSRRS